MNVHAPREVVVTGVGVVSPLGIGRQALLSTLLAGASGVRRLSFLDSRLVPAAIGGEVIGFDPKQVIKPRKSLKVMSREIQLALYAADLASGDAGLAAGGVDPERFGVVFGADMIQCDPEDLEGAARACLVDGQFDMHRWAPSGMGEIFPLWFLRCMPNMAACHIAILHDARGPCNTIAQGDVSSLLAVAEAAEVIRRGSADVMLCGGTGNRLHPTVFARSHASQLSQRALDPAGACRPFDADRDGYVNGEGAAAFVLESRERAQGRGASILASVLGHASAFEATPPGQVPTGTAIRRAIQHALAKAGLTAEEVGHVNAHGLGTIQEDIVEAVAIRDTLGQAPVTAPKSYFGNLGSGSGAVEMAVSLLALQEGTVPPTLNYRRPDPACPINVVHERPLEHTPPLVMLLNQTTMGQSAALVLGIK